MIFHDALRLGLLTVSGVVLALGCGSDEDEPSNGESCSLGESLLCTASSGCQGEKRCRADGRGYESCVCSDASGGSGGTGAGSAGSNTGGSGAAGGNASGGGAGSGGGDSSDGAAGSPSTPPSCVGLAHTCGLTGAGDCCETVAVPGGSFTLGRDPSHSDNEPCSTLTCRDDEAPVSATVTGFRLDRYEVTVGRFRKFVEAGAPPPAAGSGKHAHLSGGGITNETGWNNSWTLSPDYACHADATWTATAGDNENRPMTCISWYDAYAFCIWDGGFLPTEAEWEYVASGGEERVYPWSVPPSSTTATSTHACGANCGNALDVGQFPDGAGRWGHADLGGNVWEWTLDFYASSYASPCVDCANFTPSVDHSLRGGGYADGASALRAAARNAFGGPAEDVGARCARPMP